jgi:hypothetical protein
MAILKPGQLASGSYTISGSFSGSFQGSGAGLNNIPSSAVVGLSSSLNIGTTPIASGTVGRVLFEGTGNVLQQSGNLFWDGTNERLGIGTSTPSSQIEVFASNPIISTRIATNGIGKFNYLNSTGTAEFAGIYLNANSGEMRMYTNTTYFPTFYSSNAEIMRIPTTGNVLINTTTDAGFRLDVNGTARVQGNFQVGVGTEILQLYTGNYRSFIDGSGTGIMNIRVLTTNVMTLSPGGVAMNLAGETFVNASSIFELISTTKGFLPPRMTTTQKNAIASPAEGLMVYDTVLKRPCFYDGTSWVTL